MRIMHGESLFSVQMGGRRGVATMRWIGPQLGDRATIVIQELMKKITKLQITHEVQMGNLKSKYGDWGSSSGVWKWCKW